MAQSREHDASRPRATPRAGDASRSGDGPSPRDLTRPVGLAPERRSGPRNAFILFSRAARLRCPACASGGLFQNYFTLKERCPGCGLLFGRGDQGYQLGSMALNLLLAEGIWIVSFVAILFATWPNPPWLLLQWGSALLMVGLPILLLPFTRTLALALDVLFRPVERRELRRPPDTRPNPD